MESHCISIADRDLEELALSSKTDYQTSAGKQCALTATSQAVEDAHAAPCGSAWERIQGGVGATTNNSTPSTQRRLLSNTLAYAKYARCVWSALKRDFCDGQTGSVEM